MHAVARRHGVCSSLLYRWRRDGLGAPWPAAFAQRLIPVQVAAEHQASTPSQSEAARLERLVEITPPTGARVWLAARPTDIRCGFDGLARQVQQTLELDQFSGHVFAFGGRRGDLLKLLYWDGQGLCLFAKRLERGRFVWPAAKDGVVTLTPAQLSMLLEGIDWRMPARTLQPEMAG